jgi:hypothetical protein
MKPMNVPVHHRNIRRSTYASTKTPGVRKTRTGHMPRIDTVKMVENIIKLNGQFTSKNQLLRALPHQMQYSTLSNALNYLQDSNKIIIEQDGTIIWTFVDSDEAKRSLKESKSL